jgi:cytochrome c2
MNTQGDGAGAPKTSGPLTTVRRAFARILAAAPWLGAPRFLLGAAVAAGVLGVALGYVAAKRSLPHYVRVSMVDPAMHAMRRWLHVPEQSSWETYVTHLGTFEMLFVTVAESDDGRMAALEELDGHLLFLTQAGAFIYLNAAHELRSLDIDVPMNTDALRAAEIPNLDFGFFRALDLLAVPTGPRAFDLYVSYDRFNAEATCFEVVVSRMRMAATDDGLAPQSAWEEVFVAQPCTPPRITEGVFIGIQSGGRLALYDDHTLLLSLGDLEFDGVAYPGMTDAPNGPQNPDWDLGKIIAIDLRSGASERWAAGFRNPQGLLVDSQHRVWETEHGPQGGDEINLVRHGGNYGWPNVTYGMRYVPAGANWPLNTTFGGHEGYDRPAYVFVPSIGASQLIEPSAEEFPFWSSALLATSLRARSLFVLRLDGDRIMYAEPIPLGERLRDIVSRSNGEIAILTDFGKLILMRAPETNEARTAFTITDQRTQRPANSPAPASGADAGQQVFAGHCGSCHSLTGRASVGPPLNGVVGRDIAAVDYAFSPALRAADGAWTPERLTAFLTAPSGQFAGTTMSNPQLTRTQARDLIAYLRTTHGPDRVDD